MWSQLVAARDTFPNVHVTYIERVKKIKTEIGDGEAVGNMIIKRNCIR